MTEWTFNLRYHVKVCVKCDKVMRAVLLQNEAIITCYRHLTSYELTLAVSDVYRVYFLFILL